MPVLSLWEVAELSRDEIGSMFKLLSQLGESGDLEDSVVETIEVHPTTATHIILCRLDRTLPPLSR